jgi:hypothetical protein
LVEFHVYYGISTLPSPLLLLDLGEADQLVVDVAELIAAATKTEDKVVG